MVRGIPMGREPLHGFRVLRTRDPNEMCREIASELSDHRLEVMGRRTRSSRVNRVQIDATALLYVDFGTPVRVSADPLDAHLGVMLPVAQRLRIQIGDVVCYAEPGRAVVIPCNAAARIVIAGDPEFTTLVARIGVDELSRHMHQLAPHTAHHTPVFEPGTELNPALIAGAVHALHQPFDFGYGDLSASVQRQLHQQLMTALLFGCRHTAFDKLLSPPPAPSRANILRAVKIIEESLSNVISLIDVAEAVGLSLRALQDGFRRQLGESPRAFVKRTRLKRARAVLLAADRHDGTTVTDVAMDHGFTHLGRFAVDYRLAFGETPSESLRKSPRRRASRGQWIAVGG